MDLRLTLDENERVTAMELDPYRPRTNFQSCDVMIMDKLLLEYLVEESYARGEYDFLRDVLLKKCSTLKIFGWRYDGYVARLNSVSSFFSHNMALLEPAVRQDLFNRERPVYTKVKDEVSARYGADAEVRNAMLADGCDIDGRVENSILFRGVHIAPGAHVKNCIIMQDGYVHSGAYIENCILDKQAVIKRNARLIGPVAYPIVIAKNVVI